MTLNKNYLSKMQLLLLAICLIGFIDINQAQRGSQRFASQDDVEVRPWTPVDVVESLEIKTNRARSIQGSAPEPIFIPKTYSLRTRSGKPRVIDDSKGLKRRNFDVSQEIVTKQSEEKASTKRATFKRRSTTSTLSPNHEKSEGATSRFKVTRKPVQDSSTSTTTSSPSSSVKSFTISSTPKSRRSFTPRSTSNNVLVTTSDIPSSTKASVKRVPLKRGNFRPESSKKSVNGNTSSEDENYPEHFKLLLKNKEPVESNNKSAFKKPLKQFRPSSNEKTTSAPIRTASKSSVLFPTRTKGPKKITTTTTEIPSSTAASVTRNLRRPRPTERTKAHFGSTLPEPPTAKSTPSYATRPSIPRQVVEESMNVNTQADGQKQIDPPIREYFPRTSAIGSSLKYSSRLRNSDNASKSNKAPSYQPTVPSISTTPMAFNDGWEYSVTHPTHEKHYGSGSEVPILPPWHQSVIQPQWTFSGNRDHYSLSY